MKIKILINNISNKNITKNAHENKFFNLYQKKINPNKFQANIPFYNNSRFLGIKLINSSIFYNDLHTKEINIIK